MQTQATKEMEARDVSRLEESFRAFTAMTKDLEVAYNNLTRRAARIDLELRRSNAELEHKVVELEHLTSTKNDILDALPTGVVVIDAAGEISAVNAAASKLLGRPSHELIGRSRDRMVGPDGVKLLLPADSRLASGPGTERDAICLDGSARRLSIVRALLPDGSEVQTLTDLTVVTRLKQQMARLDTLAALGEMAAGVAHEIRNPLNGIDGFAALLDRVLRKSTGDAVAVRYAENIRRGVREINDIVTNLLHFAGTDVQASGLVDLQEILETLVQDTRRFAPADRLPEVFLRVESSLECSRIAGDQVKLKVVFGNLIKNAMEAAGPGGRVAITLKTEPQSGRFLVHVDDNGPGLPTEMRDRLFRPFSTTKAEGTGLGLALAHRFVLLHEGEIKHFDLNPGTRFVVSLPVATGPQSPSEINS